MASNICMNVSCGSESSIQWKKGWKLRSGEFAILCDDCGSIYEQLIYCDTFHLQESGWRECGSCGKPLHCGCIASKSLFELLDNGGIGCTKCLTSSLLSATQRDEEPNVASTSTDNGAKTQSISLGNKIDGFDREKPRFTAMRAHGDAHMNFLQSYKNNLNSSLWQRNREEAKYSVGESSRTGLLNLERALTGSSQIVRQEERNENLPVNTIYNSIAQSCLGMNMGAPPGIPNLGPHIPGVYVDTTEQNKLVTSFPQGQKPHPIVPKPLSICPGSSSEAPKDVVAPVRIARPPVDVRGRAQLLPRYWPKITDQELQQIAAGSNSTIVPLFEKVLSASDAGRIGRLVLPKACAEAYFPPIPLAEGIPIRIQDTNGKDWVFQFRFWPNNNSRMYVLEGITPCMQSLQLQAGDTVIFSRIDPGEKLLMGFRKASTPVPMQQGNQVSSISNSPLGNGNFFPGAVEHRPVASGHPDHIFPWLEGGMGSQINTVSQLNSGNGDTSRRHKPEENGGRPSEVLPMQPLLVSEKKRSRNIGSKSKRLLMDSEDATELKLTWEEAQDLLRPPPTVKPSTVRIDDHEFEEYEEGPVFGKKTIFTAKPSGGQDQWAQCDSCSRWRKLPADVLLPPKWTCVDNAWDPDRCSCSAPEEMSSKELDNCFRLKNDIKRRRVLTSDKSRQEHESSAKDAPVTIDNEGNPVMNSVVTTTKHPRHRPGCTCIVCIQHPSGMGPKHKPDCTCTLCLTRRRRVETNKLRKKEKQELRKGMAQPQKKPNTLQSPTMSGPEEGASTSIVLSTGPRDNDTRPSHESGFGINQKEIFSDQTTNTNFGRLDLNCYPNRDEIELLGLGASPSLSMVSLLQEASLPLDIYLKQRGLESLTWEHHYQQASSSSVSAALPEEVNQDMPSGNQISSDREREKREFESDEGHSAQDQNRDDKV